MGPSLASRVPESSPFVGPLEDLHGVPHAALGTIAVVVRNGKPERVIAPGRRMVRGVNVPLSGHLQVIQVTVDPVSTDLFTVTDIPTRDSGLAGGLRGSSIGMVEQKPAYDVRRIVLKAVVQLDPAFDYRAFRELVLRRGVNFAETLTHDLGRLLDQMVRTHLRQVTHEELYARGAADVLMPRGDLPRLDGGLFRLTGLQVVELVMSEDFLRARRSATEITTTAAIDRLRNEARLGVDVEALDHRAVLTARQMEHDANERKEGVRIDAEVLELQITTLAPLAARLGIPLVYFTNPIILRDKQDMAIKVLEQLSDPVVAATLRKVPGLLESAGAALTTSISMPTALMSSPMDAGGVPTAPRQIDPGVVHDLDLSVDTRLRRVVTTSAPSVGRIFGVVGEPIGRRAAVLIVAERADPELVEAERLPGALAGALGVDQVQVGIIAVREAQDAKGVVRSWLQRVHPGAVLERVTEDGDRLIVEIGGDPGAARAAVDALNRPDEPAAVALQSLLGSAEVDIRVGP